MLKARLIIVALLVPIAGAIALLGGTGVLHNAVTAPLEGEANAAGAAVRGALAEFANRTVDTAARAASDADIIAAITKKQLTPKAEAALLAPAPSYGAPSFAMLVAPDGAVIARAGAENKLPASLAGLPVVAEALTGLARDGLWLDGEKPVHLVASASFDNSGLVGGVVLGWEMTDELVTEFRKFVQHPVFIVAPTKLIGALGELTADNVKQRESGEPSSGTFPILVPDRHRYVSTPVPLYAGESSVTASVVVDRDPALTGIATVQLGLVAVTLALGILILVIILSTLSALTKPIEIIVDHLSQVQQGASVGILPEAGLSGQFLRLGKQINMLLQSPRGGTAPLNVSGGLGAAGIFGASADGALPPAPTSLPPAASAGMSGPVGASLPGIPAAPPVAPAPPAAPVAPLSSPTQAPPPPPSATSSPPSAPSAPSALSSLFDEPDPLAAFRVPPKTSAPPAPAPAPPPPPMADVAPEAEMNPEATVMFQVPQSLLAASQGLPATPAPPVPPPTAATEDADDNRTVVAQVPQELLSQSATKKADPASADDAHYKEVYEKFVQTRIECNEDTSDLSYDRFVAKLLKNRQQILEKHKASGVRFQVYVKDGKAALRALPVRD
jgi:hypothetical protein